MHKEAQVHNTIFRDAMLGVLLFIAAVAMLVISNTALEPLRSWFVTANIAFNASGAYFLLKAFRKDKYRPETL